MIVQEIQLKRTGLITILFSRHFRESRPRHIHPRRDFTVQVIYISNCKPRGDFRGH